MTPPSRVAVLLAAYNALDEHLRGRQGADASVSFSKLLEREATRSPFVRERLSQLHALRSLRNAIVHFRDGVERPIAEPIEEVVTEYLELVEQIIRSPRALDTVAVKGQDLFTVSWSDPVRERLTEMYRRQFRIAPVVESGCLEGVFTDTALGLEWCFGGHAAPHTAALAFGDLREWCSDLAIHSGVHLLPASMTVAQVAEAFDAAFHEGTVFNVACFTETGRFGEPLLGLVTPGDLIAARRPSRGR
jgi:hypothetical protein